MKRVKGESNRRRKHTCMLKTRASAGLRVSSKIEMARVTPKATEPEIADILWRSLL